MVHQSDLIKADIENYLHQHENKELLRFLTCGNVDDGKSTLIGRLLHDSKVIYEDQIAALKKDSTRFGTTGDDFDPALLMDGLDAEREQGITIDVAYRYFSTTRRKFIIADTPGHEQYTRNMATGASTCDLAIILIDARHGVQTQTRRHSYIASLLGIRHFVITINKMDLVGHDDSVFQKIKSDFLAFAEKLHIPDLHFIPISALKGDNVVHSSAHMAWYEGPPLMTLLDTIEISTDLNHRNPRFPVQYINRPNLNFRGYSGTIAAGVFKKGDTVKVLPSGKTSQIERIVTFDGDLQEAQVGEAVTLTLKDEIDISRGDLLIHQDDSPFVSKKLRAHLVWMAESQLVPIRPYLFKQNCHLVSGTVSRIIHRVDVNTQVHHPADALGLNEIGQVELSLNAPLVFDPYVLCKTTGSFIVIDRLSNATVGAGLILEASTDEDPDARVDQVLRERRLGQLGKTLWLGTSRAPLLNLLETRLFHLGYLPYVLQPEADATALEPICHALNKAAIIVLIGAERPDLKGSEHHLKVPDELLQIDDIVTWMSDQGVLLL